MFGCEVCAHLKRTSDTQCVYYMLSISICLSTISSNVKFHNKFCIFCIFHRLNFTVWYIECIDCTTRFDYGITLIKSISAFINWNKHWTRLNHFFGENRMQFSAFSYCMPIFWLYSVRSVPAYVLSSWCHFFRFVEKFYANVYKNTAFCKSTPCITQIQKEVKETKNHQVCVCHVFLSSSFTADFFPLSFINECATKAFYRLPMKP